MNIKELITLWESTAGGSMTEEEFRIRLPLEEAAKIQALSDMYPRRSKEEILTDLLTAALNDVESHLPYQKGPKVIGVDEEGDPLYEDVGPTPRYLDLTKKHLEDYRKKTERHH